ncbi:MAG TPA: hypothetical protein VF808_01945 [Ktedonobacterales bacterium]
MSIESSPATNHASATADTPSTRWLFTWPALVGAAYTLTWLVGLAVWPANLDIAASGRLIVATYRTSQIQAMLQIGLVEGLAALALAAVALAVGRHARQRGAARAGSAVVALGLISAAISLVQCALGEALAGWIAPAGDAMVAKTLFDLLNRLDGVKMLTLAAMAVAGMALAGAGASPRWLGRYEGALLALALVTSGCGYALLYGPLSLAAVVSLPLLLVWVTGAGIATARARHSRNQE